MIVLKQNMSDKQAVNVCLHTDYKDEQGILTVKLLF